MKRQMQLEYIYSITESTKIWSSIAYIFSLTLSQFKTALKIIKSYLSSEYNISSEYNN